MRILKSTFGFFWELLKTAVIALVLVGLIRYFLIQPFFVEGASMEPNFETGEYLIIDELSYYFRGVERGEVVVFHYPLDKSKYYIKRVVGLPGETVEIKDGEIIIYNKDFPEGRPIDEKYLPENLATDGDVKKKLLSSEYFVLGDNRPKSSDSRRWGTLPKSDVVGRAWLRLWPPSRLDLLKAPIYE